MSFKTLHLTNAYHEQSGGIRTMYHALFDQANAEQRPMRLVVPAARDGEEACGPFGRLYYVRAPRSPAIDRRHCLLLPHRFLLPEAGVLWGILRREQPDIVEVCDKYSLCYLAGLIRRRRRSPGEGPTLVGLSCERMDDNVRAHASGSAWAARAARAYLGRVYLGQFDAHIANSEYTAGELRAAMVAPHVRPIHVTPMGVHLPVPMEPATRRQMRRAVRGRLAIRVDAPLVLYAGRLSEEKGLWRLPAVAAQLARHPQAHLIVAGDGPRREQLERECQAAAPGRARFVGHLAPTALRELLAACDLFVHPNPREPFGIAPLEAMASGLAVVLPRAGGVLSYATDDNAWLTGCSADDLAEGVAAALTAPEMMATRAAAGRWTAERFAWPIAAAQMFATYDAVHRARAEALSAPACAMA